MVEKKLHIIREMRKMNFPLYISKQFDNPLLYIYMYVRYFHPTHFNSQYVLYLNNTLHCLEESTVAQVVAIEVYCVDKLISNFSWITCFRIFVTSFSVLSRTMTLFIFRMLYFIIYWVIARWAGKMPMDWRKPMLSGVGESWQTSAVCC